MQVTPDEFNTWGKDKLLPWTNEVYNNSSVSINVNGIELGPGEYTTELKASAAQAQNGSYPRCRVEIVDKITSPTYIMCQTSGFKNKSNSDLACASGDGIIPWERFYVPGDSIAEQCAPFYTVYDVITRDSAGKLLSEPRIEVNMYRVSGMYADSGGPKGGSPEGYWSLAKIYCHGENLEENREYFTGKGDEPGVTMSGFIIGILVTDLTAPLTKRFFI